MKILYSYFKYTSRIFLKWAPFFARCNIMFHEKIKYEFHGKIRRNKDWVTKKKYIEEFAWGASLFRLHAIFSKYIFFVAFFVYSLSVPKWHTCGMTPINIYIILLWVVFCVIVSWVNDQKSMNMKISCNLILACWHL